MGFSHKLSIESLDHTIFKVLAEVVVVGEIELFIECIDQVDEVLVASEYVDRTGIWTVFKPEFFE